MDFTLTVLGFSGQWTLETPYLTLEGSEDGRRTLTKPFYSSDAKALWLQLRKLPQHESFIDSVRSSLHQSIEAEMPRARRLLEALLAMAAGRRVGEEVLRLQALRAAAVQLSCDECFTQCDLAYNRCVPRCPVRDPHCEHHCADRVFDCIIACINHCDT